MNTNHSTMRRLGRATCVLLAAGALSRLPGAGSAIGTVIASGSFQIDHTRVWGNATLFEGSVIETAAASSQILLNQGVQLRLAASTRATVYEKKLVLESGYSQLDSGINYEFEARSLHVAPSTRNTVALVRLAPDRKVVVAAMQGAVRVMNSAGLLIANVEAGRSLEFEPQEAGAEAPTKATGCLLAKSGAFILAEQTANVILELRGEGLAREVGNRVEIAGQAERTAPTSGASQVIKVAQLKQVAKGGCGAIAKKLGATAGAAAAASAATGVGAAGGATAAGIGTGATVAIIGGVATAATVAGLGAAGTFSGSENPQPASR